MMGFSMLPNAVFVFTCASFIIGYAFSLGMRSGKDSECYTANGADYQGTQNVTYVRGEDDPDTTDTAYNCMRWSEVRYLMTNVTDFDKKLQENYCRNPNNRLFPYCYINIGQGPEIKYCHIPTCNTPALIGCFKLKPKEDGKLKKNLSEVPDVILNGVESLVADPKMKIGRCLNFCRSKNKYDYAGVTGGDSCLCGSEQANGDQMRDPKNKLKPHECLKLPCVGEHLQACGATNAIAIYDVEAGSCSPVPHYDRDNGTIYSPRWPGNYHNDATCQWTVYVPEKYMKDDSTRKKYQIQTWFSYFNLEKTNDTFKIYAYYNATDDGHELIQTYNGSDNPLNTRLTFEVAKIMAIHMVFTSDKDDKHDGFIMHYKIVEVLKEDVRTKATPRPTNRGRGQVTLAPPISKNASANAPGKITDVKKEKSSSLDGGVIAAIVIGVLIFIFLCLVVTFFVRKYYVAEKSARNAPAEFNNPVSFNNDTTL